MGEHYSQAQLAWRMVVELVAGLGIGFAIGYGLDSLFGDAAVAYGRVHGPSASSPG